MTITDVRFEFSLRDQVVMRHLNFLHYGIILWFDKRLKGLKRKKLGGAEVKGINILNFIFTDWPPMKDAAYLNAICYHFEIKPGDFTFRSVRDNLVVMFQMAAEKACTSSFPQVRWLSAEFLEKPCLEPWKEVEDSIRAWHQQLGLS